MSCNEYTLTSVQSHIGYDNLANILESNLKSYYDWALLCIGGWSDVTIPTSGMYGGDYSKLRVVDDPAYTLGQVWQAPRKDFVWESNINYVDPTGGIHNPLAVGTPQINGIPTLQSYYVNHPQGKIVFNTPQNPDALVQVQYSYRYAQIYRADDAQWWRELQFNSHRIDSNQIIQTDSGNWSIFGEHMVQMPAIVIETVPRGVSRGFELGSHKVEASRDVLFHIYAENRGDRNNFMDIFNLQTNRKIWLFNNNTILENNAYPLDYKGSLVNAQQYNTFVSPTGYRWNTCLMDNSTITNVTQIHPSLYQAVVKTTMSIVV